MPLGVLFVWEEVTLCPVAQPGVDWKLTWQNEVEMATVDEKEIRAMFRAMHDKDASTRKLASAGRGNAADPYNGENFLTEFEAMLDKNFEIADEVFEKFGD